MKRIEKTKENLLKFISTNKLFLCYLIISVAIGFLLRIKTTSTPIYFKAFAADTLMSLIFGSFGFLIKNNKARYKYYMIWIVFSSLLAIGNNIYYGFYESFISVNLIGTASMLGEVNDAFFDKIHLNHFIYLIFPLIFFLYYKYLNKNNYFNKLEEMELLNNKKIFRNLYIIIFILFACIMVTFTSVDGSRFIKLWNREYVVKKYGIYVYTVNDLVQSIQPKINTLFGYDEAASEFRDFYACKFEEKKHKNEYSGIFKGKNVLFIHAESIQNFLINLEINGDEVTPNINKLAREGIYFDRFYPQISVGTSSDTEFTLSTGLMPSSSGTVFVNYYDRKYYALPNYFNKMGYYTFSTHANNADYWNRKTMHKSFGYKDFFAEESYDVPSDINDPEYIGLGLSDSSFFRQFIPKLKEIKNNNKNYMGNIITLSNHAPFGDVDKYDDFNLSLDYTYVDDDGDEIDDTANYLNESSMGDYIKSSHYADRAFGELMEGLEEEGLLDNLVIIFYGDHEARLGKKEFDLLYNYDPVNDDIKSKDSEDYKDVYGYYYELLKNTPLIIWSSDKEFNIVNDSAMGMYDVLPTVANLFGFSEKYSLGHDIFDDYYDNIVVFPNGNVLTDKVYYSDLNDEYIAFTDLPIERDYIDELRNYSETILDISNGIITHDLIRREESKIGRCENEQKER